MSDTFTLIGEAAESALESVDARTASKEIEAARVLIAQLGDLLTDDDELLRDTLEGETNVLEILRGIVVSIGEDEARIEGLKAYKKALDARQARFEQRIESFRGLALSALELMGKKKHEFDIATLSEAKTPATVTYTDQSEIPSQFWIEQPPKLDKKAVAAALKAKEAVPGAVLGNGGRALVIRWR